MQPGFHDTFRDEKGLQEKKPWKWQRARQTRDDRLMGFEINKTT